MWEILRAYLLDFIDSKSQILMLNSAQTLCNIVNLASQFLPAFLAKLALEPSEDNKHFISEKWNLDNYQDTLFQALTAIFVVSNLQVMETVFKVLKPISK